VNYIQAIIEEEYQRLKSVEKHYKNLDNTTDQRIIKLLERTKENLKIVKAYRKFGKHFMGESN